MSMPATVLNDLFMTKSASPEAQAKIAEFASGYIRDKLREASFARKILPPQPIERSKCQVSTEHDTLVKIEEVEPQSRAMSMSFRGQPTARFIRAPRFAIPFFTISSEKFEKTEQELMAYQMPITKIIEENSVKDIQEIEDRQFLIYIEAAVQAVQLEANGGTFSGTNSMKAANVVGGTTVQSSVVKGEGALTAGTDDFVVHPVMKQDFIKLKKLLHRKKLRAERLVLTEPDYDDISMWTLQDVGHQIVGETSVEGWKANTVTGLKIIRTIKTDILREGNIYCFTSPDFLGRFYILNQTKFYIDKIANLITWQSWEDIGIGIGNIAAIVKLELYSGSVTPGQLSTGSTAAVPVAESALQSTTNHRIDDGKTYPRVSTF